MSDIKQIIFVAKRTLSTVSRHVSVVQTRSDAARPPWRRHLQEQQKPLLCRHVQMQLKPLWCRHLQEQHKPLLCRPVQMQLKPLWCRHLQEQH
jgi:hypothetical protein